MSHRSKLWIWVNDKSNKRGNLQISEYQASYITYLLQSWVQCTQCKYQEEMLWASLCLTFMISFYLIWLVGVVLVKKKTKPVRGGAADFIFKRLKSLCRCVCVCVSVRVVFPQVPSARLVSVFGAGRPRYPQRGGDKRIQTPEPLVSTARSRLWQRDQGISSAVSLITEGSSSHFTH